MLPESLARVIIILVTVIWAANFILQFIVTGYHPDVTLNAIFMAIVGGALALSRKNKGDGSGGDDS